MYVLCDFSEFLRHVFQFDNSQLIIVFLVEKMHYVDLVEIFNNQSAAFHVAKKNLVYLVKVEQFYSEKWILW